LAQALEHAEGMMFGNQVIPPIRAQGGVGIAAQVQDVIE